MSGDPVLSGSVRNHRRDDVNRRAVVSTIDMVTMVVTQMCISRAHKPKEQEKRDNQF